MFAASPSKQRGFTLVELVTTILLIAILSVVALPRLFSASSYSAFSLRDEFIAELRQLQMKALNNSDRCYRLSVTPAGYQGLHLSRDGSGLCTVLERSDALQPLPRNTRLELVAGGADSFDIDFDSSGRPELGASGLNCSGDCIAVIADETLKIAIESEGYIHAN